jgi:NADH dehydrogenase/NADH:ubiquinone oxidoreductase subunit G
LTSTAKSLWGEFKKAVMDAGLFDMLKCSLESIINKVQELKNNGDLKLWATKTALAIVQAFQHINTVIGGSAEVAIAFGRAFNAIYGNVVKIVGGLAAIQLNETTEFLNAAKEAQAAGKSFDGRDAGPELDAYVREIETRVQSLKATADAAVAIVEKSDAVGASWKGLQGRTVSAANNVATTLNKQVEALKKQAEEQSKHKAQLEEHNKASELAEKYQKNLNTALEQGYSKVGAIREAYNSLTEDLAKLGEVSEQTAGKLLRLAQARAQSNAGPGGDVTGTIAAALDEAERTE